MISMIREHGARAIRLMTPLLMVCAAKAAEGQATQGPPSIFAPESAPADSIFHLSLFVLSITGGIFVVVAGLLTWALIRYRARGDDTREPPQIYGSTQVELAWTVVPILIVVVLFLTTARIIFAIQDAPKPKSALDVTVVGHQFWWEFRYPKYGIVTANELHVPLGSATFLHLLSADVMHSFWVPQLAGKTDLIPNHPNETWIEPERPGLYLGQCAQFCGIEHAKMLLRVYVDTPAQFAAWVRDQQQPGIQDPQVAAGRQVFETHACTNCHAIAGTAATGRFGPDLTHLASRDTLASGAVVNTPANLHEWIKDPDHFKEGALMPAMQLNDSEIDELVAYLDTLH
ncbi:MAG TPA: cytochrome c oxidase subunit II [Acidobacteriaceae bacterium]|jgi:cytochrome c oxidase subunit 2|nr:cytochrome c oxidase subunit II [Acidobacteriaceae bacterium]